MGRSNKFDYQAAIKMSLIAYPDGLSLDELVEHSGLKVDRSTLFRHLTHLIEQGRAERVGKARASRYRPLDLARPAPDPEPPNTQGPAAQPVPESVERPLPDETPFSPSSEVGELHQSGHTEQGGVPSRAPEQDAVVKKAVRTIVREWKRCNRVNLQIYLSFLVKPEHLDELAAAVEKELASLHEDNLDRFGLTPAEFAGFTPLAGPETTGA
jgi:hypothetical protein